MSSLRALDICALTVWMLIDGVVVFRRRTAPATRKDRLSLNAIALAIPTGISLAIYLAIHGVGVPRASMVPLQLAGLALLALGIVVRSVAIAQLGAFHAPDVAIQEGHHVVEAGLYRHVRHPSYLGGLTALLGFGLGLGSWVSGAVMLGMALPAYGYRIHVEEQALLGALGSAYAAYRERTYRLIPWLY